MSSIFVNPDACVFMVGSLSIEFNQSGFTQRQESGITYVLRATDDHVVEHVDADDLAGLDQLACDS